MEVEVLLVQSGCDVALFEANHHVEEDNLMRRVAKIPDEFRATVIDPFFESIPEVGVCVFVGTTEPNSKDIVDESAVEG